MLHDKEEVEHMNSAEISDLRHSKKELKLENKRLWNSMKGLRDEIRGLRDEITGLRDGIKNKDEVEEQGRAKSPAHRHVHYNFSYISMHFSAMRATNSSIPSFGYCGFVPIMIL